MRSLVKAQEEQQQLNSTILESLTDLQKKIDFGQGTSRPEASKSSTRRRRRTSSGSSDSEESSGDTTSSSRKRKIRRHHRDHSWDEFKKAKYPTFDNEVNTGQEAKARLLGIKKYFQVQDYSENSKARVAIFNLNGRASIWWEHLRQVKRISERTLKWKLFKNYFKQKYLSDRYYYDNIKEFHEMKLGQMTMEEYSNKFLEMLRYFRYIKDDKVKF